VPPRTRSHRADQPLYAADALEARVFLAGVTIVTHGYGGNADGWVAAMANAIAAKVGPSAAVYKMTASDNGANGPIVVSAPVPDGTVNPATSANPEIMIRLDWSQMAGSGLFGGYHRSSVDVGAAVAKKLLGDGMGGNASLIPGVSSLLSLPVHLIGHSRGGSLVGEIAKDLGASGVVVDQVTTLDPHPVDGTHGIDPGNFGDTSPSHWSNVKFWDNYWRRDSSEFVPDGQSVSGALNDPQTAGDPDLFETRLESANQYGLLEGGNHSDDHLWYFGTIAGPGASDSSHSVPTTGNWYPGTDAWKSTGFYYSLIGGGARPAGGIGTDFGGTGAVAAVARSGSQWPYVDSLVVQNPAGPIVIGDPISLSYQYQDYDSSATITWFADQDQNPFDGSTQLPGPQVVASSAGILAGTYSGSTAGLDPSDKYIYARIADGAGQVRYSYLPGQTNLIAATPYVVSLAAGANGVIVKKDADGVSADVTVNGGGVQKVLIAQMSSFTVKGNSGDDVVTVDFSGGDPLPALGMSFNGGGGSDSVRFIGTSGDDTLALTAGSATFTAAMFGSVPITLNGVPAVQFIGGSGGSDTLNVLSGTFNIDASTATGTPNVSVIVGSGAAASFTADQRIAALTINGGLADLGSHTLLTTASGAAIHGYLAGGFGANQDWAGTSGLTSALAKGNPVKYTVGYADGNDQSAQDAGVAVSPGQVLVKPTLVGDANLDGKVDFFDVTQVLGYKYNTAQAASYTDGDLDYSGVVDFFDISMLLSANYNTGQVFAAAPAAAAEAVTVPSAKPAIAWPASPAAPWWEGRRRWRFA
jgi:hypothetical protein